jgi:hypothetical protein
VPGRWLLAAGVAAAALLLPDLTRAGYSPDEEFTRFAVRGIHAGGLPLLPSGLLYDRGLVYSYAAAVAGLTAGDSLVPGRLVSLAAAAAALAVVFHEVRRMASPGAGALAVVLAAASLPFWVSATTARFYAPFLLGYVAVLAALSRLSLSWTGLAALALAAAVTRWTHELAFTLLAVPVIVAVVSPGARRPWIVRSIAVAAGLAAGQFVLLAVHAVAPPSNGDVMVRRFLVWQVLNLFERPPLDLPALLPAGAAAGVTAALALAALRARVDLPAAALLAVGGVAAALGQLALAPAAVLAALPVLPGPARRLVPMALGVLVAGSAFWIVALTTAGLSVGEAVTRIFATGAVYPLDMFAHLVRETPLLVVATASGLVARSAGLGGAWTAPQRAVHALWIGWVLWFGVIESGITARYLLLPVTFMLCATAIDMAAIATLTAKSLRPVVAGLMAMAAVVLTLESWGGVPTDTARAAAARPTLVLDSLRAEIQPGDLVAGGDELATLATAGRIDAWLALDGFFRERFVVIRDGQPTGTYTGAAAAFELGPLLDRAERGARRLVVVDVLKDMPGFGSTAALVPRQLAIERLRGEVLAEVPGARLIHVVRSGEDAVARLESRRRR